MYDSTENTDAGISELISGMGGEMPSDHLSAAKSDLTALNQVGEIFLAKLDELTLTAAGS